jgi:hypothetical protein
MFPFPFSTGSNGAAAAATVSFVASTVSGTAARSYTFSSHAIGAAAANRKVVVGVSGITGGRAVSTVTVGGNSASLVIAKLSAGEAVELWQVELAAGTTGDIVVDFGAGGNFDGCGIGVWAVYGAAAAATDTGGSSAADPATDTLNIPAGGVAIGVVGHRVATPDLFSWTNLTERYDETVVSEGGHSGASDAFAAAQTALAITASAASAGFRAEVMSILAQGRPPLKSAIQGVILEPRREHSRKPGVVRSMIESQVDGPYLEMFARERAPGWSAWGNETDRFTAEGTR